MNIIAADIGGTKSWLAIMDAASGQLLHEARLLNQKYDNFYDLLADFIDSGKQAVKRLYLALPAPVNRDEVKLTNLHWVISATELKSRLGIAQVQFFNDFQAAALGTTTIPEDQLVILNDQPADPAGIRAATGAGTGLGVAYMHWQHGQYHPFATEAGHMTFAPADAEQLTLRDYLATRYGHVSYERILSGPGIEDLYRHLDQQKPSSGTRSAKWVNEQASAGNETAQRAMTLFARIFGAFASNLAVIFKPQGGLYITGGVSAKTAPWLQGNEFREAFAHKGRMSALAMATPVYLVNNEKVGLQGAIQFAIRDIKKESMS
jgi:glucokinase